MKELYNKFKEHTKETTFGMNFAPDTNHTDECVAIAKAYANQRVVEELESWKRDFQSSLEIHDTVKIALLITDFNKRIKELKE